MLENGNWCVKGHYKDIVENVEDEDEDVEWTFSDGIFSLIMCLVSYNLNLISDYLAM